MRKLHRILNPMLFVLLLFTVSDCITDNGSCGEYKVGIRMTNKSGVLLPDSIVNTIRMYMFVGGKYSYEVQMESGNNCFVSFDNSQPMQLVAIGAGANDSMSLVPPVVGDNINSICVRLQPIANKIAKINNAKTRYLADKRATSCYLFYGDFNYNSNDTVKDSAKQTLTVINKNARIHIVVNNLLTMIGEGKYSVRLDGFRNAMAFDGTIKGDNISYQPEGGFDSNGKFITDVINAFPTLPTDVVIFTLYKDGNRIFSTSKDASGNTIKLNPGDDKAIVVDFGNNGMNIKVIPWNEENNKIIFY